MGSFDREALARDIDAALMGASKQQGKPLHFTSALLNALAESIAAVGRHAANSNDQMAAEVQQLRQTVAALEQRLK
jgi:ubiquinone biosynthesis protein UbiJ